ncbi:hypothetical protein LIER_00276 [Lithospermum erythrorhizon]|uniref:Rho termination factor-like N-terminal domain-containing protein n=1 Tax=Lithospermum erythrorhizon TaxID=34254 RepID=A0AAV3NLG3_LITER
MSPAIHFIANNVPGYVPPDGSSGVSGRVVTASSCSSFSDHRFCQMRKSSTLKCAVRSTSYVCNASASGSDRNPDFFRQNRKVFSRSRDRNLQYEERDSFGNLEDTEMSVSRNGHARTSSGSSKFQATATPGPREKEIVELFRKVQARLREKAAMKEEKKAEEGQGEGKENKTVDSLLKLLRKHSVQQGKKNSYSNITNDFVQEQAEPSGLLTEDKSFSTPGSNRSLKHQQNSDVSVTSRPRSVFQRRSPIQQVKTQPVFKEAVDSVENSYTKYKELKFGLVEIPELDLESESDTEQLFSDDDVNAAMLEDESEETCEPDEDNKAVDESEGLSEMKLPELRAMAKLRGLKGFSKLKKQELIKLLGGH